MALIWLIVGIAFVIVELFSLTFVLLMFAVGAFAASAIAAVGGSLLWQVAAFAVISCISLGLVRPLIRKYIHLGGDNQSKIGLDAIESSIAVVLEHVDANSGSVKIDGEIWRARPYDATQVIPVGERVRVIEINGATAMVWRD